MLKYSYTEVLVLSRKYGAVIVKDDVVTSTGYNGSQRGRKITVVILASVQE